MSVKLNIDEIKKIEIDILKRVDEYCKVNELEYCLAYGTLLGAVRHNGFIPWDDDIDIFMPRKSYECFLKLFNLENDRYRVIHVDNTANYPYPFAKVIDTYTYLNEKRFVPYELGVYIDIFPLDFVGDSLEQSKRLNRSIEKRRKLLKIKTLNLKYYTGLKKIVLIVLKLVTSPFKSFFLIKKIDKLSKKYSEKRTKYIASMVALNYGTREIFETELFDEYTKIPFENVKFNVPLEYEKILKLIYGDYMILPALEDRVAHHPFEAGWKKD